MAGPSLDDLLKGGAQQNKAPSFEDLLKGGADTGKVAAPATQAAQPAPGSTPPSQEPGASSYDGSEGGIGRALDLIGEGVLRGGVNVAGLPASADEWLQGQAKANLPPWLSKLLTSAPGSQGLHDVLPDLSDTNRFTSELEAKYGGRIKPPQTMGERFLSATGQGIGGGVVGGVGVLGPLDAALSGASAGAASQAAAEIDPNSKVAPIVAGIVGGATPAGGVRAAGEAVARSPVGQLLEKTFSPTTVDASARDAEALIRDKLGQGTRDTAISAEKLMPLRSKVVSLPDADRLNLIKYMETRSTGQAPTIPTELQPVADAARDAFQLRETKLSNLSAYQQKEFIEDYYPHMWQDPKAARQFAQGWGGKEGSGRNLKARSIPTMEDGIAAGLVPRSTDPIQNTLDYVANMDRFIATKQVMEEGLNHGLVKAVPLGSRPPPDMVKINTGRAPGNADYYAPEGFARVYNNFTSKGFYGNDTAGEWYDGLQKVNGSINAMQLGLSAFHYATMAQESIVNGVAKGIQEAFSGSPFKGAMSIAKAPAGPVRLAWKGGDVMREYVRPNSSRDPVMREIVDLGTQANMNPKQLTQDLRASDAGSYWKAIRRGTLKMELAADARTARGAPITGTAKVFFKNMGRVLDSFSQPLFEMYIPRLKAGAFYDNMKSWLEANPGASQTEKIAAARQLWDSTDNRFGLMNHDNVFWNQALKQSARLAFRSYSWKLGTLREIGGGLADLAKSPTSLSMKTAQFSPAAAYAIALPLTYGALMAAYQYMKTGQAPQDLHDLVAARTGGTDAATQKPERVQLPSYMRDVFGWARDASTYPGQGFMPQEVSNSFSPLLQNAKEIATNRDYKDQPIADPNADLPTWLSQWMGHIISSYAPISFQQQQQGAKRGSKISAIERAFNVQPASRFVTDPAGYARMMHGIGSGLEKKKTKTENRQKAQYGGID